MTEFTIKVREGIYDKEFGRYEIRDSCEDGRNLYMESKRFIGHINGPTGNCFISIKRTRGAGTSRVGIFRSNGLSQKQMHDLLFAFETGTNQAILDEKEENVVDTE